MKRKRLLQYILVNDVCWLFIRPFVYLSTRLQLSRENFLLRKQEDANESLCGRLFETKTVLNGLFKGMKMGNIKATGSSIYAKLLGSYELEIVPELARLLSQRYDLLINVGSDEGYYAVGIARMQPRVKVYAFDCNKRARSACEALALLNDVGERVITKGCFNKAELPGVAAGEKALFIFDCEGCESEIITEQIPGSFASADFIIELHFEKYHLVAEKLSVLFSHTHNLKLVDALSDHERVMRYDFPEISGLDYQQKNFILNEREGYMQWLIATPKS